MVKGIEGNDKKGSFENGRGREKGRGKGRGLGRERSLKMGFENEDEEFKNGMEGDEMNEIFEEKKGENMVEKGFEIEFEEREEKKKRKIIWIEEERDEKEYGWIYKKGINELGIDKERILIVSWKKEKDVMKEENDEMEEGRGGKE